MTQQFPADTAKTRAVELLVSGESQGDTAHVVGVTRWTINRWVNHDPEFRALIAEAHAAAVQSVHHRLAGLTETAVDTLAAICEHGERDADRLNAAKAILDRVTPFDVQPGDVGEFDLRDVLGDGYNDVMDAIAKASDQRTGGNQ